MGRWLRVWLSVCLVVSLSAGVAAPAFAYSQQFGPFRITLPAGLTDMDFSWVDQAPAAPGVQVDALVQNDDARRKIEVYATAASASSGERPYLGQWFSPRNVDAYTRCIVQAVTPYGSGLMVRVVIDFNSATGYTGTNANKRYLRDTYPVGTTFNLVLGFYNPDGTPKAGLTGTNNLPGLRSMFAVPNSNQPPQVAAGGPYAVDEGSAVTLTAAASDPEGGAVTLDWDFNDDGVFDDAAGSAPTFSAAAVDGPAMATVRVRAADPQGATAFASAMVMVANVAPTVGAVQLTASTIQVGDTVTGSATFTDPAAADTHSSVWDWGDGETSAGTASGGVASATHAYGGWGTFSVAARVADDDGGEGQAASSAEVLVNAAPSVDASGPYTVAEGDTVALSATFDDPWGGNVEVSWDLDGDGEYDDASGLDTLFDASALDGPTQRIVSVRADDGVGGVGTDSAVIDVVNVAPTITGISGPGAPVPVGSAIALSATYADPCAADTFAGTWSWGDGTSCPAGCGQCTATGGHTYTTPGIYTVKLEVADDDGGCGTCEYAFVVAYDPSGGFVTGGGWIDSPTGAYAPAPDATGKASFGFVSKYQKGASVPSGNTEFQFHAAGFSFRSVSYDWLVIAGAKAQYKGLGTVNGSPGYAFMMTAVDGQVTGGGGTDRLRLKVWDRASGAIVYDNLLGAADSADPTTVLGGGSVVVHKAK